MSDRLATSWRRRRRWPLTAVVFAMVALFVGALASVGLNRDLAISFEAKDLPTEPALKVPAALAPASAPDIEGILMPAGYADDPLLSHAAGRLAAAMNVRTGMSE
jgi:hypothetical protein